RQRARIAGAAPSTEGPYVRRAVSHADAPDRAKRLPAMSAEQRATLPGVSLVRAQQLAAGALVADAVMDLLGLEELEICPWALREGVLLRRIDTLAAPPPPLPPLPPSARHGPRRPASCASSWSWRPPL